MFVDHMRGKQAELDKFVINSVKSDSFKAEMRKLFEDLSSHIDKLAPCDSVYPHSPGEE